LVRAEPKSALSNTPQVSGFPPDAKLRYLLIANDVLSETLWEQLQALEITVASLALFQPEDLCEYVALDVATARKLIEAAEAFLRREVTVAHDEAASRMSDSNCDSASASGCCHVGL
jgi:hypothetical protein